MTDTPDPRAVAQDAFWLHPDAPAAAPGYTAQINAGINRAIEALTTRELLTNPTPPAAPGGWLLVPTAAGPNAGHARLTVVGATHWSEIYLTPDVLRRFIAGAVDTLNRIDPPVRCGSGADSALAAAQAEHRRLNTCPVCGACCCEDHTPVAPGGAPPGAATSGHGGTGGTGGTGGSNHRPPGAVTA